MINISEGEIYQSNNYGSFEIISVKSKKHIKIKFVSTGYEAIYSSNRIASGSVKDLFSPSVYGVGFMGVGEFKSRENKIKTKAYVLWSGILQRCYDPNYQSYNNSYIGCTVAEEWHNFQVFSEWYADNYIEGYHLDKDKLRTTGVTGKLYSPKTCVFISQQENNEISKAKHFSVVSPSGEIINGFNLNKFSKDNGLTNNSMSLVISGKLNHHKGWRLP